MKFGGVLKRRGPQMCTFGLSGCRVNPLRLSQNVKNNFTIDLLSSLRPPKKSITNCFKFCLHPEKKKLQTQPKFHGNTPSHLRDPHSGPSLFLGCCLCCLCCSCFCCCRCFCCCLRLFLLFVELLLLFSAFAAAFGSATVEPHLCSV